MKTLSQNNSLYEQDYYLWLLQTSKLLQEGKLNQVDINSLIEEIDSMGRSEKKEIKSRLIILIEHLLKLNYWQAEKEYNARGWRNTVVEQRLQIDLSLEDSPSLIKVLDESFLDCYNKARISTLQKYQLSGDLFPIQPPFSLEDILDSNYLP
ncbi:MAG: hypothetical protein AUK43_00240 [Oscillatoriales cyanobacterium CG2_30_40_61]|nr:MAG: hypothetical protein AUK43_00240 [Oscillatoriales cyanobacterium CG2_30_40_61]